MKIPEEAVEAAARAVFLNGYPKGCGVSWDPESPIAQGIKRDITIALEAATPYMQAEIAAANHASQGGHPTVYARVQP